MALSRVEVSAGLVAELGDFEELVRSLDATDLTTASRCEGWTVADVAAHVIGTYADIVAGNLDGAGTPEYTARQVEERRGRTAAELAEELAGARKVAADLLAAFDDAAWAGPPPANLNGTLGFNIEALWYDAYLHADDIRAALGRPGVVGDGLKASVSHIADVLTQNGWGPATIAVDGLPDFPVGDGSGPRITGDPMRFVLAATGRIPTAEIGQPESINIYR